MDICLDLTGDQADILTGEHLDQEVLCDPGEAIWMPSPDGPTLSFTSEQQEVPPVLGVLNQSCEAHIYRLIMYSRFVGIAYIMFSFFKYKMC